MPPVIQIIDPVAEYQRVQRAMPELARRARIHPDIFQAFVLKDDRTGAGVTLAPMHEAWHALLTRYKRLVLWAHVEAAKTNSVAISRVLWEVGRDPSIRVLILSNTHTQAARIINALAAYIEQSRELHMVFRDLVPTQRMWEPWKPLSGQLTVKRPNVSKDATITASGLHGAILGARYDLVILDDVLDYENARTAEHRKQTMDWLQATVHGRLTRNGRMWVVGTAFHPCLLPQTLVVTARGVVRADELLQDDVLLVGPGMWQRAKDTGAKQVETEAVEIRLRGIADPVVLTINHRVPTDGGLIEAGDVTVGMRMLYDRASLIEGVEVEHELAPDVRVRPSNKKYHKAAKITREQLAAEIAAGMKYGDIATKYGYKSGRKMVHYMVRSLGIEPRHQGHEPPPGWSSTEAWWRFAGYWLAEGSASLRNNLVRLSFGLIEDLEEVSFAEEAAQAARDALGIPVHTYRVRRPNGRDQISVWFACRTVAAWLRSNLGYKARTKVLSPWVEQVPMRLARPFFEAYWRGDGCTTSCGTRFSTASRSLAYGLQRWLINLGAAAIVCKSEHRSFGSADLSEFYEVRLGYDAATLMELPRFERKKKQPAQTLLTTERAEFRVVSVKRFSYSGWIYDLQTESGWFALPNVRVHNSDVLHEYARRFSSDGVKRAFKYPVLDDDGNPRWPEQWPAERIEQRRLELTPVEFARQMMCEARDDAHSRFKQEWIDVALKRGEGKDLAYALKSVPQGCHVFTGVDLAVQQHSAADLTVLFTIIVHPNGDRELLEIQSGRWAGPDIVNRIVDVHHRFQSIVIVENNASQDFLLQFTRAVSSVPIRPFTTGRNKAHPEFGVESLATEIMNGKWIVPNHGGVTHPEVQAWIQDMLYYAPTAHTGDRLMASWFAREGARQGVPKAEVGRLELMRR